MKNINNSSQENKELPKFNKGLQNFINIESSNNLGYIPEKRQFFCKNLIFIFITSFGWFLIIFLITLLGFKYQYYHPPKIYYSLSPKVPWNSDYTPKIFLHMADIHISFFLGFRTNGSTDYYSDFLNYNPDLILSSGDVVDSYERNYWPKVGAQWISDWGIYPNLKL